MKITIDTENKLIGITRATSEELIKIGKDYPGYLIQSGFNFQSYPVYPSYPVINDPIIGPYCGTINCGTANGNNYASTTSGETLIVTNGTTTKVEGNWSYTSEIKP